MASFAFSLLKSNSSTAYEYCPNEETMVIIAYQDDDII